MFLRRLPVAGARRTAEPRLVRLKRIQAELGVQICGGNLCGILVESLDEDSPVKTPDGLLPGDLLLEVSSDSLDYNGALTCAVPQLGVSWP